MIAIQRVDAGATGISQFSALTREHVLGCVATHAATTQVKALIASCALMVIAGLLLHRFKNYCRQNLKFYQDACIFSLDNGITKSYKIIKATSGSGYSKCTVRLRPEALAWYIASSECFINCCSSSGLRVSDEVAAPILTVIELPATFTSRT